MHTKTYSSNRPSCLLRNLGFVVALPLIFLPFTFVSGHGLDSDAGGSQTVIFDSFKR